MKIKVEAYDCTNALEVEWEFEATDVPRAGDILIAKGRDWHVGRAYWHLGDGYVRIMAESYR